jgi:hypothetical protein
MGRMILPEPARRALLVPLVTLLTDGCFVSAKEPIFVKDYPVNTSSLPIEGTETAGLVWIEGMDSNIVVISEKLNGKPCDRGYSHRLYGYRFIKKEGEWKQLWVIRDQASGCQEIQYFDSTLQVADVDENGTAETLFFYSLFSDGTDPQILKMMFHYNGEKMPIRGRIPVTDEDTSAYEMKPDPKLKTAPESALHFAIGTWKNFLSKNFRENVPSAALKQSF